MLSFSGRRPSLLVADKPDCTKLGFGPPCPRCPQSESPRQPHHSLRPVFAQEVEKARPRRGLAHPPAPGAGSLFRLRWRCDTRDNFFFWGFCATRGRGLFSRWGLANNCDFATRHAAPGFLGQTSQGVPPRFRRKLGVSVKPTSPPPFHDAPCPPSARAAPRTTVPAFKRWKPPVLFKYRQRRPRLSGLSRSEFGPSRTTSRTITSGSGHPSISHRRSASAPVYFGGYVSQRSPAAKLPKGRIAPARFASAMSQASTFTACTHARA